MRSAALPFLVLAAIFVFTGCSSKGQGSASKSGSGGANKGASTNKGKIEGTKWASRAGSGYQAKYFKQEFQWDGTCTYEIGGGRVDGTYSFGGGDDVYLNFPGLPPGAGRGKSDQSVAIHVNGTVMTLTLEGHTTTYDTVR